MSGPTLQLQWLRESHAEFTEISGGETLIAERWTGVAHDGAWCRTGTSAVETVTHGELPRYLGGLVPLLPTDTDDPAWRAGLLTARVSRDGETVFGLRLWAVDGTWYARHDEPRGAWHTPCDPDLVAMLIAHAGLAFTLATKEPTHV